MKRVTNTDEELFTTINSMRINTMMLDLSTNQYYGVYCILTISEHIWNSINIYINGYMNPIYDYKLYFSELLSIKMESMFYITLLDNREKFENYLKDIIEALYNFDYTRHQRAYNYMHEILFHQYKTELIEHIEMIYYNFSCHSYNWYN